MTVQQQVANRIINMSDEGAMLIDQIINSMSAAFFVSDNADKIEVDVLKRFGAGKGIIKNTDEFDKYNKEIADMFEASQ